MSTKLSNPKDIVGATKIPLHLWPYTATAMGSMGLLDGMLKYGRTNWRVAGVRASIYADAAARHISYWFEGEDTDPDSGLSHLAHALACLAIIVDAQAAGKLNDDRMYPGGFRALMTELAPHVKRLKDMHADKTPKHYTAQDARDGTAGNDLSFGGGEVPAPLASPREDEQPVPLGDSGQLVLGAEGLVGGVEIPPGQADGAAAGVAQSPTSRGTTCGDDYGVGSAPRRSHLYGRFVAGPNDH